VVFKACAFYSDGGSQDISDSNQTAWQRRDKQICHFDGPKNNVATGLRGGVATIGVTHRRRKDEVTCTVTPREDQTPRAACRVRP
jgi:hypothetical protein